MHLDIEHSPYLSTPPPNLKILRPCSRTMMASIWPPWSREAASRDLWWGQNPRPLFALITVHFCLTHGHLTVHFCECNDCIYVHHLNNCKATISTWPVATDYWVSCASGQIVKSEQGERFPRFPVPSLSFFLTPSFPSLSPFPSLPSLPLEVVPLALYPTRGSGGVL